MKKTATARPVPKERAAVLVTRIVATMAVLVVLGIGVFLDHLLWNGS
ncbi:hypothetical protein ACTQ50_01965 [Blautia sp. Sow4_E7]